MTRLIIDIMLLLLATLNIVFIILYASRSRWKETAIGQNLMSTKVALTIICLLFPLFYLFGVGDNLALRLCQIVIFIGLIILFSRDIINLVKAQNQSRKK